MLEIPATTRVLRIATARIDYRPEDNDHVLDITVKSASEPVGKLMAPKWRMVLDYKEERISWETYREQYRKLLRKRYANARYAALFHDLIREIIDNNERLVLVCYCNTGPDSQKCHRFLMADYLEKIARSEGYEVSNEGELSRGKEPEASPQLLLGL